MTHDELESLSVCSPCDIGWDRQTPPNETVDAEGNPFPEERHFGVPDPCCPSLRVHDDPEVVDLRERLRSCNGITGLEICTPDEVDRAAAIFRRDGFVVVRDLLDQERLDRFRKACVGILRKILEIRGFGGRKYMTESFRLPHRYSFGTCSASRELLHHPVWASMVDLPTTAPILTRIFGSEDYRVFGAGGDVCLPGAIEYQHLHADGRDDHGLPAGRIDQAKRLGVDVSDDDPYTRQRILEVTAPFVTINFLMSETTRENGPIRQIPGTHARGMKPPAPEHEPAWMKYSTLVGAPAGAGVIRDNRAWHGGTPNLGREVRAMPNVEYVPPWHPEHLSRQTMPHEIWQSLSPRAKKRCRLIKAPPGVWPAGAGAMHPLAAERRKLAEPVPNG